VFFPWLRTWRHLRLNAIRDGYAVLADEPTSLLTSPDGFVVDANGLRNEPLLLSGFAPDMQTRDASDGHGSLDGQITITGAWPANADAVSQQLPTGGCLGCWNRYHWQGKRWVLIGGAEFLPDWWKASDLGPAPSSVRFPNGTILWEKFSANDESETTGKSVFFNDPHGRVRSKRQRTVGPNTCNLDTRIVGKFSGVGLSDGSLLSIGRDCTTRVVAAEYWKGGAVTSTFIELPGQPHSIGTRSVFADPVRYGVRSERDVAIAFEQDLADDSVDPYIALFDGTEFHRVASPAVGQIWNVLRPPDGSVWLAFGTSVWRHPGLSNPSAPFTRICEDLPLDDSWEVVPRPNSDPWLRSTRQIVSIENGVCRGLALPTAGNSPSEGRYSPFALQFLANGDPIVVAGSDTDNVLLLTKPTSNVLRQ
jgi:hypothetical protein